MHAWNVSGGIALFGNCYKRDQPSISSDIPLENGFGLSKSLCEPAPNSIFHDSCFHIFTCEMRFHLEIMLSGIVSQPALKFLHCISVFTSLGDDRDPEV